MRLLITLNDIQVSALEEMMKDDLQDNKSGYMGFLVAQEYKRRQEEKNRKQPGRPRKGEVNASTDDEEWPDENEPRTLTVPTHLEDYLILADRKKKVNAYDIMMLEEKRKHHLAQNATK